jgi:hypothetical protein
VNVNKYTKMKRHLDETCNTTCNKKIKGDNVQLETCNNKPSIPYTLTEAEKEARRAEQQRNYKRRVK